MTRLSHDVHIFHTQMARELFAEHSPPFCEVRGRKYDDGEPTPRYPTIDLGDHYRTQWQLIHEQYAVGWQV